MTAGYAVAILAGGQSRRMGTNKAFVPLGGKSLIAHVIDRVKAPQMPVYLIVDDPAKYAKFASPTVQLIKDVYPQQGPAGGLLSALLLIPHEVVALVGCDMPFVNPKLLALIAAMANDKDAEAVVPRWEDQAQPLHGIYRKSAAAKVQAFLEADQRRMTDLLDRMETWYVDESAYAEVEPEGLAFMNVNTPEDLEAIREALEGN